MNLKQTKPEKYETEEIVPPPDLGPLEDKLQPLMVSEVKKKINHMMASVAAKKAKEAVVKNQVVMGKEFKVYYVLVCV